MVIPMLNHKHISRVFVTVLLLGCIGGSHQASPCYGITPAECVAKMTLDEKAGQMAAVGHNYLSSASDIKTYFLGTILAGGGFGPGGVEGGSATQWADMFDNYQKIALTTRLQIPALTAVDAVHGHNNVVGATIFPHHIGLGATNDTDLVSRIGNAVRKELRATGVSLNYAPCVAVARDDRWGRVFESFSEDTYTVRNLVQREIEGMQGGSGGVQSKYVVAATAKHFLADGGTTYGTGSSEDDYLIDQGDFRKSDSVLRKIHLPPYQAAVASNVAAVMVSYSSINGTKMHASKKWITDELKGKLGFKGIVTSDWEGIDYLYPDMSDLSSDYAKAIRTGINAGIDMVMVPDRYKSFISLLKQEVNGGRIAMSRINDAVTRILTVKYGLQLFDYPLADRTRLSLVGGSDHRALAREAVAKSQVLLKKSNGKDGQPLLPLLKTGTYKILIAGKGANNMRNQCGGWTVSWQGTGVSESGASSVPQPKGTTIYAGIKSAVASNTGITVTYKSTSDLSAASSAHIGIAVVGETPYAEGIGDVSSLTLSSSDVNVIKTVCSKSTRGCIVIVLSGRPLVIKDYLSLAPVWIAGWLPGSEGGGVADVLFGSMPFTGKLSYTWPKSTSQEPTNFDDGTASDPQFKFKFGLS